jgi:hypothetical protein
MNVQPPIQHKFIALPGSTQRDAAVDNIGRRPSLAMGKKPNAMRGHLVAVRTPFPSRCLLRLRSLLTSDPVHRRVPRHLHVPLLRLCCSQCCTPGLQGLWFGSHADYRRTLVHLARLRLQSRGQRLGLLPHQRRSLQPSCDPRPHAHRLPDIPPRCRGFGRADRGCYCGLRCCEGPVSLRESLHLAPCDEESAC